MSNSTERTSVWTRGRRLAVAGIAGAVLLGGGASLAYAGQQDTTGPTSGYGTVVDEQGAPVQTWPRQTADRSGSQGTASGSTGTEDRSTIGTEDCPGWDGERGDRTGGGSTPSETPTPNTLDGDQL